MDKINVLTRTNNNKYIENIKKTFDWKEYIYINSSKFKKEITDKSSAWLHFKKIGFELGLNYKCSQNVAINENLYRVLIVMPTYNRCNKIQKIINMLLRQTFTKWFFLIIDDGSDFKNKQIFNKIKCNYNSDKILFFENINNLGIAKTLNKGINYLLENAFTHFTWISDDNIYLPSFLNTLICDNTYFRYTSYYVEQDNLLFINNIHYKNDNDIINNWGGCASFMWTKDAIKKIGYYDETIPFCEDYDYIIRTFKNNYKDCLFLNTPLMKYIYHDMCGSIVNKDKINNLANIIKNKYNKE